MARLKDSIEERPLISSLQDPLQLKEFITKHLFERSFYYEKSKFKVKTDDLDINTIVNLICKLLT
jgi:shikimate kinase